METCCICKKEFKGYGNNAEPIKKGTCCDKCNKTFVILARMLDISMMSEKEKKQQLKEIRKLAMREGDSVEKVHN